MTAHASALPPPRFAVTSPCAALTGATRPRTVPLMERVPAAAPGAAKVPLSIRLGYGLGAAAYGIKDNGFATFLLIFYNQVMGLNAAAVGVVIAVALVFDAFVDPMLGVLSDRTDSRWGRRHPWLYASAVPIAIVWVALWNPPGGWSEPALLGWLFVTAVLARAAIATNEVPSLALAPELTRDYHERTSVIRYRYVFGWLGGLIFLMLAFGWFLAPPRGSMSGPLGVTGFGNYGIASAIAMASVVLISAYATHKFAVDRAPPPVPRQSFAELMVAVRQTLSNKAFLILMAGGVLIYTAQGVSFALSNYLLTFVWQLKSGELLLYALALFVGVIVSFFIVTPIGRRLGKPRAAAALTIVAVSLIVLPYLLRLAGLFPPPGDPWLLPAYLGIAICSTAASVAGFMTSASMMSDVVEASEETTGRREEGLFFAGALFMQKCSSGLGILITGQVLAAIQFPEGAVPGAVALPILDRMTMFFCAIYFGLGLIAALVTLRFPFGHAEHEARLAKLAVAEAAGAGAIGAVPPLTAPISGLEKPGVAGH